MDIFKLVGSVLIDTNDAENSLSKVDDKAEKTGKSFSEMAGTAGKVALGIGAAAAGAGAAILGFANEAASAADEVDKGSIRMGISAEAYQELRYAAGQCGVEMSVMEKAAKKLEGTDLNFEDAINEIMSLGDETERSNKAAELFGENIAYQLSPILSGSGEQFSDLRSRAHDLGIVMSGEAVAAGVKMGDSMSDVKQSLSAVGTQVGSELMPVVQTMLDWILKHMPEIQATVKKVIEFVQDLIKKLMPVIEAMMPVIEAVFKLVENLWNTVLEPVLMGILEFLEGVFTGDWKKAWQGLSDIVSSIFNGLVDLVKKPLNTIIGYINDFFDSFGEIDIPSWVPIIGGKTFSLPNIPYLANGGDIIGSGAAIVGEAGPELIDLPAGARVTPISGYDKKLDTVIDLLSAYLPQIGSDIVVDNKVLGQVINKQLGTIL